MMEATNGDVLSGWRQVQGNDYAEAQQRPRSVLALSPLDLFHRRTGWNNLARTETVDINNSSHDRCIWCNVGVSKGMSIIATSSRLTASQFSLS
jgi:hypothetical protein